MSVELIVDLSYGKFEIFFAEIFHSYLIQSLAAVILRIFSS